MRNFRAGRCIGACLEYAARKGVPVMIYVFSDGSLNSTGMVDSSANGRGKFGWQGDNQSVANSFFMVYSPKAGRPRRPSRRQARQRLGAQIGSYRADGSIDTASHPGANAVNLLVQTVVLNYMALHGETGSFARVRSRRSAVRACGAAPRQVGGIRADLWQHHHHVMRANRRQNGAPSLHLDVTACGPASDGARQSCHTCSCARGCRAFPTFAPIL